jgi:putative endonuclease
VYLVRCSDDSIYTGISTDVRARVETHNAGTGAKYTRSRRPVYLVYTAIAGSRSGALREERRIKALPRCEKESLIRGWDP